MRKRYNCVGDDVEGGRKGETLSTLLWLHLQRAVGHLHLRLEALGSSTFYRHFSAVFLPR